MAGLKQLSITVDPIAQDEHVAGIPLDPIVHERQRGPNSDSHETHLDLVIVASTYV